METIVLGFRWQPVFLIELCKAPYFSEIVDEQISDIVYIELSVLIWKFYPAEYKYYTKSR